MWESAPKKSSQFRLTHALEANLFARQCSATLLHATIESQASRHETGSQVGLSLRPGLERKM